MDFFLNFETHCAQIFRFYLAVYVIMRKFKSIGISTLLVKILDGCVLDMHSF